MLRIADGVNNLNCTNGEKTSVNAKLYYKNSLKILFAFNIKLLLKLEAFNDFFNPIEWPQGRNSLNILLEYL